MPGTWHGRVMAALLVRVLVLRWQNHHQLHTGSPASWRTRTAVTTASAHRGMPISSSTLEQKLCRKLEAARSHRDACTDPTRRSKITAAVEALEARLQQLIEAREGSGTGESVEPKRKVKQADVSRRPKRQRQTSTGATGVGSLAAGAAIGDGLGIPLGERVARAALLAFDSLPSRGKPQPHEWTVLAAFVAVHPKDGNSSTVGGAGDACHGRTDSNEQVEVLAIGTGTKCVGASRMSTFGDRLHDSHAEIIARRALRRYILAEYTAILRSEGQNAGTRGVLLERRSGDRKIGYRPGVQLALYINQPPCGDASIFDTGAVLSVATEGIRCMSGDSSSGVTADGASSAFTKQTGAKPVTATALDAQAVGVLRTKSGRSDLRAEDRSSSMSCSDKIAKWNVLGVGGALLSILLPGETLYINHLVVGQPPQQSQGPILAALQRAVVDRANEVVLEQQPLPSARDDDRLNEIGNGNLMMAGYSTPAQRDACPGDTHCSSALVVTLHYCSLTPLVYFAVKQEVLESPCIFPLSVGSKRHVLTRRSQRVSVKLHLRISASRRVVSVWPGTRQLGILTLLTNMALQARLTG